jgi:hypothetical protein
MEPYRHALYRYSTGQGFNVNVNVPKDADRVASYKMEPLYTKLMRPEFSVDLKREADRVSMQVESGMQQIKVLGYDSKLGKGLKKLKVQLEVIKHLMTTYPIRYIKKEDLEKIYSQYAKNAPGMDAIIKKVVAQNKGATGIQDFVGTAMKVRKGYPLFDKFGRKLSKSDKTKFEGEKGLSGFAEAASGHNIIKIIAILLVVGALWKTVSPSA